jgi:hypothetical protein
VRSELCDRGLHNVSSVDRALELTGLSHWPRCGPGPGPCPPAYNHILRAPSQGILPGKRLCQVVKLSDAVSSFSHLTTSVTVGPRSRDCQPLAGDERFGLSDCPAGHRISRSAPSFIHSGPATRRSLQSGPARGGPQDVAGVPDQASAERGAREGAGAAAAAPRPPTVGSPN